MIKFENTKVVGFEDAIRGMRNPKNSWARSDSPYDEFLAKKCDECYEVSCCGCNLDGKHDFTHPFEIGPNDLDLMKRLRNAGTDHRKFMRMLVVYVDITAPLYW